MNRVEVLEAAAQAEMFSGYVTVVLQLAEDVVPDLTILLAVARAFKEYSAIAVTLSAGEISASLDTAGMGRLRNHG